ncbi:SDR family oxidoreductase [Propioniciclava coleopterorum]|uniref:SDR family oxidoreductase n=1 Tax=Propioniciclava coleopterorum TaxID=2714937 RepID=A0A6G7Y7J1_9ACTN|nr:SDR family oxidoreductase [Propioniciclava coleopterorum]QIK72782.1 SDR family oxidoreductase [Propioniciclava coleopterorum]
MDVLILGGHGKVALLLAPLLVARGDTVDSVIRNPEQADAVRASGANPIVADIESLSTDALADLIHGHHAVVWSAGAGGGDPQRTYAVDKDAAIRSIDAAEHAGVRRYVMVSYFGSDLNHGVEAGSGFFPYAEAKAAADTYLRASDLSWTVVSPSTLTLEAPTGRIDAAASTSGSVSRADVAGVIAAVLANPTTAGRTIRFNSGETEIAAAVAR